MARLARVVIPGLPHHVTQRGNGRAKTFFGDDDYALYRDLLASHCRAAGVEVWGWCLMPNHVHLILVPSDADGLRRALSRVHRIYAGTIQARRKRTGHLSHFRLGAVSMNGECFRRRCAEVALDPIRRWSGQARAGTGGGRARRPVCAARGKRAHRAGADQAALSALAELLAGEPELEPEMLDRLRAAEGIGRPLGNDRFLTRLETANRPHAQTRQARAGTGERKTPPLRGQARWETG